MNKKVTNRGRKSEMYVALGQKTIARFKALYAEGDFTAISDSIKEPKTTRQTVTKHLRAASENPDWKMPLSIAKASQAFYQKKEKEEKALAA